MLRGIGVLPNSSLCYVYAENLNLLPHSLGKTTVNLTRTHVVLTNGGSILYFSEEGLLQSHTIQPESQQQLDGIMERATSRGHTQGYERGE